MAALQPVREEFARGFLPYRLPVQDGADGLLPGGRPAGEPPVVLRGVLGGHTGGERVHEGEEQVDDPAELPHLFGRVGEFLAGGHQGARQDPLSDPDAAQHLVQTDPAAGELTRFARPSVPVSVQPPSP